jgi:hypothetical protein
MNRILFVFALSALSFVPVSTGLIQAQESADDEARKTGEAAAPEKDLQSKLGELGAVNEEIRGLEKRLAELRCAWRESRARLERDLGRSRRRVELAKEKAAELAGMAKRKEGELAELEEDEKNLKEVNRSISALAGGYFDELAESVDRGIPWRKSERLKEIARARISLEGENPNPLSVLSAVERMQKREESLGRITESGTVRIEREGRKMEVQAFHLGRLGVIIADREGTFGAFVKRGQSLEEGLAESGKHPEAVSTYVRAIDILFKRRAPHVADLYLPGLPTSSLRSRP